jgi:hypothetical protein
MAIAERTAESTWEGGLARGHGTVKRHSKAFADGVDPLLRRAQGGTAEAAALCPISRLLAGAQITVDAILESA